MQVACVGVSRGADEGARPWALRHATRRRVDKKNSCRQAMGQPAEPSEALIPITIRIPGNLAESLRTHVRSSGHSIGEIVAGALRRFFWDADRHG